MLPSVFMCKCLDSSCGPCQPTSGPDFNHATMAIQHYGGVPGQLVWRKTVNGSIQQKLFNPSMSQLSHSRCLPLKRRQSQQQNGNSNKKFKTDDENLVQPSDEDQCSTLRNVTDKTSTKVSAESRNTPNLAKKFPLTNSMLDDESNTNAFQLYDLKY